MSRYLDRLKQLEDETVSQSTPNIELTKVTKGALGGFVSTGNGIIQKNLDGMSEVHFMWRVIKPEGEFSVTTFPEATLAEMRKWHPEALKIEPIDDLNG